MSKSALHIQLINAQIRVLYARHAKYAAQSAVKQKNFAKIWDLTEHGGKALDRKYKLIRSSALTLKFNAVKPLTF